jgi:hypothetical protein
MAQGKHRELSSGEFYLAMADWCCSKIRLSTFRLFGLIRLSEDIIVGLVGLVGAVLEFAIILFVISDVQMLFMAIIILMLC